LAHYRRILDSTDANTIPKPIRSMYNNYVNYDIGHNSADILLCEQIVRIKFPNMHNAFLQMFDMHEYIPYNMFILDKTMFNEYCNFLFGVLFEFARINSLISYEDVINRITKMRDSYVTYKHDYLTVKLTSVDYQARIFGFLAERISTAFFITHTDKLKFANTIEG